MKQRKKTANKIKALFIGILAVILGITLILYALNVESIGYSAVLIFIAAILIIIFGIFAFRRYSDVSKGMPFEDERSRRVMEKATSKAFYITLYMLLIFGLLSEDVIHFRDVSQTTSVSVGLMALLFLIFRIYYNKKEI